MRKEYVQQEFEKADILSDLDPKEIAKEAKLNLIHRILFAIVWPLVKPYIQKKLGEKFAEVIESILEGI